MPTTSPHNRRDRLVTIAHYITAFVLSLEGVSHLEHRPVPWGFVALCWSCALAVVTVTAWHNDLEPRFPALQVVVHLAEALVCFALVYLTHHEGKAYLPFAWLLGGTCLLGRALLEFRRVRVRAVSSTTHVGSPAVQAARTTGSNA